MPWLLGGSADLAPSCKTRLTFDGAGDLFAENPGGRNLHSGIRDHAMGLVLNGMALVKLRAYGSSFLIFSDYARPAIRLSALMELPVVYAFTHDSIGVSKDGPTHQPVEQVASLRSIPGLIVPRPADANEVVEAGAGEAEEGVTIVERALEFVPSGSRVGLGSGRAAQAFVSAIGEKARSGVLEIHGVATSEETARLAANQGIPLQTLAEAGILDVTVDGADEVDPNLDLIKGYGRALLREKIVAASSRSLVILVGVEKLVPKLGTRGKLPVEVTPFGLPLCERRLLELGCKPILDVRAGRPFVSDNGNYIVDCEIEPLADARQLDLDIRAIPGVVGTGLFLNMADTVLVGDDDSFRLIEERRRAVGVDGC